METYLHNGREKSGPYTSEQIQEMLRNNRLEGFTHFWRDGLDVWKPVGELGGHASDADPTPRLITKQEGTPLDLATLGSRFVAGLLDALILGVPMAIIFPMLPFIGDLVLGAAYTIPLMAHDGFRGTLGMRIMGIQVVDRNGATITSSTSAIRYLVSILSGLLLMGGYIVMFFSKNRQTMHDMAASTYVIKKQC